MTDLMDFDRILSSMSTAFNKPSDGAPAIDLNNDKTLKWRALQNNQYARKVIKKGVPQTTEETTTATTEEEGCLTGRISNSENGGGGNNLVSQIKLETTESKSTLTGSQQQNIINTTSSDHLDKGVVDMNLGGIDDKNIANNNIEETIIDEQQQQSPHKKIRNSTESTESPTRRLRRSKPIDQSDDSVKKSLAIIGNENDIRIPPKRRGRSKKIIESIDTQIDDVSNNKKLRRSDRNSLGDVVKNEELIETNIVTTSNLIDNNNGNDDKKIGGDILGGNRNEMKLKRTRRSTRLEGKGDIEENIEIIKEDTEMHVDFKEEQSVKSPTELKIFELTSAGESEKSFINNEKIPKRRGRRSKITPTNNNTTSSNTSLDINKDLPIIMTTVHKKNSNLKVSATTTATKDVPTSQRPLRRIKPTPKILENDELRYEFETKNIARITAFSAENILPVGEIDDGFIEPTKTALTTATLKKDSKESMSLSSSQSSQHYQKLNLTVDNHRSNSTSNLVKKKLFQKNDNTVGNTINTTTNTTNFTVPPPNKPCPDPEQFLNEIKAAKLNLNKSPEDKKLNRKQHRKLLKQKEKHFEKLGLKRNITREITDSEASSGDNEEFLPSKKINVGKPNVTLRIRQSNNKDGGLIAIPGSSKDQHQGQQKSSTGNGTHQQRKQRIKLNPQLGKAKTISTNNVNQNNNNFTNNNNNNQTDMIINSNQSIRNELNENFICLCHKPSHYYTRNTPDTAFCCAIDNIEEQKVGCCNQLSGELLNLLRPSQRVGYMILCEDHTKRMKAHNCCAGCGIFCTQGKFVLCQKEHFFHADCAQKFILNSPYDPTTTTDYTSPTLVLKCPHCGQDTPEKTSLVTMKCQTLPVFLPSQKTLLKPAKMTLPDRHHQQSNKLPKRKLPVCVELENLIPESVMNVVVREGNIENNSSNEFTSKDMFYAINNDDLERVAEILASGYDITSEMPEFLNGTCLHLVAHFGTIQMAYLLLCRESSDDFLNMIDKELRTAIMCSIIGDKVDILKLFIQCGSNLAKKGPDGMTCLHIAAKVGNIQATQLIVESHKNSSNINSFDKFINSQDDGGWTAIVWAAELGFTEIVSLLLNNGANPNICDAENNSVLHWATLSNHVETISVLLRSSIDCSIQNINGDTPLHIACRSSSTRICLMLIANGADLMVKNRAQELPYDCIINEESQCARAVGFNMQMRSFGPTGLRNKIINSDISNGRELHPIQVVKRDRNGIERTETSEVDEIMIPDFKYITKSILLQNSIQMDYRVSQMRICSCNDGCNSEECQCSTISIQNWYTPEGRLNGEFNYDDPAMIFECNDVCGCNKLICKNRVVQNGVKIPLQVFECEEHTKGWGVRALTNILHGTFIAEYTGEILTDLEADGRTDDSYFFDLGASEHCIDANFYGNISRFFNHSCSPNIVPVRVYYEHQDFRFPKIAFFASKDIPDGEELCFDYGDKFWHIKQKYFNCKCKLAKCRYSNSTSSINITKTIIITNGVA